MDAGLGREPEALIGAERGGRHGRRRTGLVGEDERGLGATNFADRVRVDRARFIGGFPTRESGAVSACLWRVREMGTDFLASGDDQAETA